VARLGEPFEQVDPKFGGTGLGLAISMKLAAAMGGKILVESQRGTGSSFTMLVRAALPA
jgi:signal transduction histidine kinase